MKIEFLTACTIECCIGFDEEEEPIFEEETIQEGEIFQDVEIEEANSPELVQVEFGNGSVSFIHKNLLKIIED
jgi:hypothetical protein